MVNLVTIRMGGAGTNKSLGLVEKKKGFACIDIPGNTTSGRRACFSLLVLYYCTMLLVRSRRKIPRDIAVGLHHERVTNIRYSLPTVLVGTISYVCEVWFEFLLFGIVEVESVNVVFGGEERRARQPNEGQI